MKVWQSLALGAAAGLTVTYWLIAGGEKLGFREVVAENPETLIYLLAVSTFGLLAAIWLLLQRASGRAAAEKIIALQDHRADPQLIDAVVEVATKNGRKSQVLEDLQAARIARGATGLLVKDAYWLMARAAGTPLDGDDGLPPWSHSPSSGAPGA